MPKNELKEKILNEIATGATAQECADKYNIPAGTIRSWLFRLKNGGAATKKENVAEKEKKPVTKNATQRKPATQHKDVAAKNKAAAKEKEPVVKLEDVDEELTEMQRLFCLYYTKDPVAGTAAKKAGYSEKCAYELGYQLLHNPSVRREIERLKKLKQESIIFGIEDLVEKHMRIAFSNITDVMEFGRVEVPVMGPFGPITVKDKVVDPETGRKKTVKIALTKIINDARFMESANVDGGIIQEVKVGRNGASIKLYDAQKSMDWLERYFEWNPLDKHKQRFDREKLKLEREKLELQREAVEKENGKTPEQGVMIVDDIK
jgi:phage terminase small subunit